MEEGAALLDEFGIGVVYHYAPMHYLPFIARVGALLSKSELLRRGYTAEHFRSTSHRQDIARGFGDYVHLTVNAHPPILAAKLGAGFPHFEIAVPAARVDAGDYLLCRFNIARTRYFRGARKEPTENAKNGRYYGAMLLPVAATLDERRALLEHNHGSSMIEVLVPNELRLTAGTLLRFFNAEDLARATDVLQRLGTPAFELEQDRTLAYHATARYARAVDAALERAIEDPLWTGDGLEFDRV